MKDTHQSSSCSNQERFLSILRSWLISIQKLIICCLLSEEQEHTERWVLSGRLGNQPLLGGECYFHTISRADRHTNTENSHIHVTLWHSTLLWPGNKMCLCVALMRLWRWSLGKPSSALHRHTLIHRRIRWCGTVRLHTHTNFFNFSVSKHYFSSMNFIFSR